MFYPPGFLPMAPDSIQSALPKSSKIIVATLAKGEGGGVLTPLSNIKLAEFRYGKEEILALFDKNVKPPEEIVNFGTLFVEKCQYPLNLMQVS